MYARDRQILVDRERELVNVRNTEIGRVIMRRRESVSD